MEKSKHTEHSALSSLRKKRDCLVIGQIIYILNGKKQIRENDLGNGSLGKISFLTNYCCYRTNRVSSFSNIK